MLLKWVKLPVKGLRGERGMVISDIIYETSYDTLQRSTLLRKHQDYVKDKSTIGSVRRSKQLN